MKDILKQPPGGDQYRVHDHIDKCWMPSNFLRKEYGIKHYKKHQKR